MIRWKIAALLGFLAFLFGEGALAAASLGRAWGWEALLSGLCLAVAVLVVRVGTGKRA